MALLSQARLLMLNFHIKLNERNGDSEPLSGMTSCCLNKNKSFLLIFLLRGQFAIANALGSGNLEGFVSREKFASL